MRDNGKERNSRVKHPQAWAVQGCVTSYKERCQGEKNSWVNGAQAWAARDERPLGWEEQGTCTSSSPIRVASLCCSKKEDVDMDAPRIFTCYRHTDYFANRTWGRRRNSAHSRRPSAESVTILVLLCSQWQDQKSGKKTIGCWADLTIPQFLFQNHVTQPRTSWQLWIDNRWYCGRTA